MNIVILIKEVPDITRITSNNWNLDKGTLKRNTLPSSINPKDLLALSLGVNLKRQTNSVNKIIVLSMGPATSTEVLYQGISLGADMGILLSDKKFAGSDTYGTAKIISMGIRKIITEYFNPNEEFIIMGGAFSTDGDTGQVPPQIAEDLGLPIIPNVTGFTVDNELCFKLSTNDIVTLDKSAVIAVDNYKYNLEPSFKKLRASKLNNNVIIWDSRVLNFNGDEILAKTRVIKIYKALDEPHRNVTVLDCPKRFYRSIINNISRNLDDDREICPSSVEDTLSKPIGVYIETLDGVVAEITGELLSMARVLSNSTFSKVFAITNLPPDSKELEKIIYLGADEVYNICGVPENILLENALIHNIATIINKTEPQILLFPGTKTGRIISSRVAYKTNSGLTADCTQLEIQNNGIDKTLLQTRPALGGNIMATIITKDNAIQMVSLRQGQIKSYLENTKRTGSVTQTDWIDSGENLYKEQKSTFEIEDLFNKEIIVAIGHGIKNTGDIKKYITPFINILSKISSNVSIAGSRKAVEKGLIQKNLQVGLTGVSVSPKVYIAIGISGAVQHREGIKNSKKIFAINKDPEANIFNLSDYGIIGDYREIIPQLTESLGGGKIEY